ncbi:MAG TPA: ATP-binding protein [Pyrinomonadaceae bacterium]|jgi:nitrogen fixation/metabolism regulation signal transduction histidine kinase
MSRYGNRIHLSLWVGIGLFLLAVAFVVLLYAVVPDTPASRGPLLLTSFIAIILGGSLCLLFLLRWLLRPYRQLVGEAERASLQTQIQPSKDEAEFVLETFQSVVAQLDTQRKELKKLSEQASARANSAERFSERVIASVPSGLVAFDGSGLSMVINAPGRQLLDADGSALGQSADSLLRNIPRLAEIVHECLETGKLFRREEIEAITTNNLPRRIGATVAPIDLSSDSGKRGVLCLLTDITEVTQLREQVSLKRNLESLGEMSAGLAHEFKNTIATLHGYIQLLQNLELDERGKLATDSLLNEVRNLSEMVTAFLNFARPQPLELEPVSVSELIDECGVELQPLFEQRRVELIIHESNDQLEIRGDERMLRQALVNLIRNAAEAIGDEQQERRVEITKSREVAQLGTTRGVIQIKDSGKGIPANDLHRIFIPFFTTKATGHGVGLALAHRVITEHGGTLEATNSSDGGAIFTLKFPV